MSAKLTQLLKDFGIADEQIDIVLENVGRVNQQITQDGLVSRQMGTEEGMSEEDAMGEEEMDESVIELDESVINAVADQVFSRLSDQLQEAVDSYKNRAAELEQQNKTFADLVARMAAMIESSEDEADDVPASQKTRVSYRPTQDKVDEEGKPLNFAEMAKRQLAKRETE